MAPTLFHFTGLKVGKMFSFSSLATASDENESLVGFSCTLVSATAVVRIKKVFSGHLIGEQIALEVQ